MTTESPLLHLPISRKWPPRDPTRLQLYSLPTPNGVKVSIMLEEMGLPYEAHRVSFDSGDQRSPEFAWLNPNRKIPAIVDPDGPKGPQEPLALWESGAILLYLANKPQGRHLLPEGEAERWETLQWLMWQMGGVGPMLGQVHHFVKYNKGKSAYAEERYSKEAARLYGVLDRRLEGREFLAGEYSIADIATWPWISRFEWQEIDLNKFPNVRRWYTTIANRPAVQRGYKIPKDVGEIPMP